MWRSWEEISEIRDGVLILFKKKTDQTRDWKIFLQGGLTQFIKPFYNWGLLISLISSKRNHSQLWWQEKKTTLWGITLQGRSLLKKHQQILEHFLFNQNWGENQKKWISFIETYSSRPSQTERCWTSLHQWTDGSLTGKYWFRQIWERI